MAKTVAEIDGDSSGLVSALDKGKAGMKDLGAQGKKLTDQLKDVADQADVAAGNLVNALGGPGAIKAIGGVGIAFAGVKAGVDAFMDSAENMFRSMGDEGQAVWDQVEKSLFGIKGAFAEAVLGSDDMYEAGGKLQAIFDIVKDAIDAVMVILKPFTVALEGLLTLVADYGTKAKEAADKLRQQAEAQTKVKETGDLAATTLQTLKEKMMALRGETENLRDIQLASYQMDAKMAGERILQAERVQDEAEAKGALAGRMEEVNKLTQDQVGLMAQYGVVGNSMEEREAARVERFALNSAAILAEEIKKREGLSASRQAEYNEAAKLYGEFEVMRMTNEGAPKPTTTPTGGGGGKGPEKTAAEIEAEELKAINDLRLANTEGEKKNELDRLKWDDEQRDAKYEKEKAALEGQIAFGQQMLDEAAAERKAKGILTAEEEDTLYQERLSKALAYVQDLAGQEIGVYMQNAAKQLAIGKLSAKAASDMARSALGNMIIGQGDKAMAEAGIMAASLNPLAIPMAAAGLAAYAIGNAMMPTVKPTAGSTPATEKPADGGQAASNNYSFNMRVDSVFADGESVARQFAMMQESARARGLLMQGA
jgi:hypothetical protein